MYRIFDIHLNSDVELPELPEVAGGRSDFHFYLSNGSYGLKEPEWILYLQSSSNRIPTAYARVENGYLLKFLDIATFFVSIQEKKIISYPEPLTRLHTLRHLLLDAVAPSILGQMGRLVIHASAIMLQDGKGLAFLGSSGWGKSTIASSFFIDGARLITDDCLQIDIEDEQVLATPNYPGVRLLKDSAERFFTDDHKFTRVAEYTDKKRLIMYSNPQQHSKSKLQALFILNDPHQESLSDKVTIRRFHGSESLMHIIRKAFLIDYKDTASVSRLFSKAGKISATGLPVYSLCFPRSYKHLSEIRRAVISKVT